MIVCLKCGAEDDNAMDPMLTMAVKREKVININCARCGSYELVVMEMTNIPVVIIKEEHDTGRDIGSS